MSAIHGLAVLFRSKGRIFGCCVAAMLVLGALFASGASAAAAPTTTYLALGDSISFGYTQEKFNLHKPNEAPVYFEEGFTNGFVKYLKKGTEVGPTVRLVNDGCPRETSNGLIGENEALGGQTSTEGPFTEGYPGGHPQGPGDFHPCAYHNVSGLPLHNSLGSLSQLEDALVVLEKEKVEAITLQIGSNDELAAVEECKAEVTQELTEKHYSEQPHGSGNIYALNGEGAHDKKIGEIAVGICVLNKAKTVTFPRIIENVVDAAKKLDEVGGYTGPIIVLGYYNPQSFILGGSDALQKELNTRLVEALEASGLTNIHYANPFPKFNPQPEQGPKEKKAIEKYTEMCNPNVQKPETGNDPGCEGDIHPSLAGYKLMAKLVNKAYLAPALP